MVSKGKVDALSIFAGGMGYVGYAMKRVVDEEGG